jgi:hypothetical protein
MLKLVVPTKFIFLTQSTIGNSEFSYIPHKKDISIDAEL